MEINLQNREKKSHFGFVQGKEIVVQDFRNLIKKVCINAFAIENAINIGAVEVQFLGEPRYRMFRLVEYSLYFLS